MNNIATFIFGYLLAMSTSCCTTTNASKKDIPTPVKPKFKIGDCVTMYGFAPFKIYEIWINEHVNDYVVVLDATCQEKNRVLCDSSSPGYSIKNVDENGKLVACPERK